MSDMKKWNSLVPIYKKTEKWKLFWAMIFGKKVQGQDGHFLLRGYEYKGNLFITQLKEPHQ